MDWLASKQYELTRVSQMDQQREAHKRGRGERFEQQSRETGSEG